ncbi:MAG: STAS domain-containing protein [Candidatus Omnitrophota bacterium]
MRIIRKDHDMVSILELQGELGKNESKELTTFIEKMMEEKRYYFVLDIEQIRFMDSQAIIALLRINREVLGYGGGIKLFRPKKVVQQFMNIGHVLELFDRYETKIEAIHAFDELIKRKENLLEETNPLAQAGRNQRLILMRLLEILIRKEIFDLNEFNSEIMQSTHLVLRLFRKQIEASRF